MYSKKIIVFGSQGFVGSNIINYYSSKKNKLVGIGRKSKLTNNKKLFKNNKIKIYENDFFDLSLLNKIDFKQSTIIFSAINGKESKKEYIIKVRKLIEYLSNKNISNFILLSSISVYGNYNYAVDEDTPLNPINLYAKNCLIVENICKEIFIKKKINLSILRIANIIGYPKKNLGLIEKILLNNKVNLYSFSKTNLIRSYIFIDELIKLINKIISKKFEFEIFNVCNSNYIFSFKKLITILRKEKLINYTISYNKEKNIIQKSICDTTKIKNYFKLRVKLVKSKI